MKKFIAIGLSLLTLSSTAQEHPCAKHKQQSYTSRIEMEAKLAALAPQTSHEIKYDIKYVHLNLEVERNTKFIKGGVTTVATVTIATLDTFQTLLHLNHTIDSVRFNNQLVTVLRQDSLVKIKAPTALNNGNSFTVTIYYKGTAPS
jgi:hypothetical protein